MKNGMVSLLTGSLALSALAATTNVFDRTVAIREPNYDKSKIGAYTLEDPLTFLDGREVRTVADWGERRREILGIFAHEMYGAEPPPPETVLTEKTLEKTTAAGFATLRQYKMWFKKDKTGPAINWAVWTPRHAKGRVPVILLLNYRGNYELVKDPELPVMTAWTRSRPGAENHAADDASRGAHQNNNNDFVFPLQSIMARGYAVMSACYCEVSPDPDPGEPNPRYRQDPFAYTGVFDLWGARDPARDDNTTAIGAWAWALSRGLDLSGRIPGIDARRSVVTGYSRLGKAALLAAARDERFAVCVPVQTGGGGCPLAKRDYGENVSTENRMFTHWYCRAYAKYAADPAKLLTFDQHMLLACIAPRCLLVAGFDSPWFDTEGEFLAVKAANRVWRRLRYRGMSEDVPWPGDFETCAIGEEVGYVRRSEGHGISGHDWKWMLDFTDHAFELDIGAKRKHFSEDAAPLDLQARIDEAARKGGGTVSVPAGKWETKPFVLRSRVTLHLSDGAVVFASTNIADYAAQEGERTFVSAVDAEDVRITGKGVLDGRGYAFREANTLAGESQPQQLPVMLRFTRCRNLVLEDFTYRRAGAWGCHLRNCDGVVIRRVACRNHVNNTNDGIDIESSNVVVENCDIDADDDAIVFKTESDVNFPVTNVVVRNCRLASCCNALKFGTGSYCDFKDIRIEDCVFSRPTDNYRFDHSRFTGKPGLLTGLAGMALEVCDGGRMDGIVIRNIQIDGYLSPVFIRLERRRPPQPGRETYLRNVLIENVTGVADSRIASSITGVPGLRPRDITLRNCTFAFPGGGTDADARRPVPECESDYPEVVMFEERNLPAWAFYVRHADNVRFENVRCHLLTDDARRDFVIDDAEVIR